jgi:hypothetical protein
MSRDCFCGAPDCDECSGHRACDRELERLRDRWANLEAFIVSRTPAGGPGPSAVDVLARMDELEGEE